MINTVLQKKLFQNFKNDNQPDNNPKVSCPVTGVVLTSQLRHTAESITALAVLKLFIYY